MFEEVKVPSFYLGVGGVLALYGTGRFTGVVVDSGDGVTHTLPVCEGYLMPYNVMRSNLAGSDVTDHMMKLLSELGFVYHSTAEKEIARKMKESCCYVA